MLIGIDASRAFLKRRTGIEGYSYQIIRHLCDAIPKTNRVVLYVRGRWSVEDGKWRVLGQKIDFEIPSNWSVRVLWAPRFWTQWRLSLEMLLHGPDVLFVPAHTVPIIHPKKTVVTIHGLEYEMLPGAYSFLERLCMRVFITFSATAASTVIAVSENTKRDLIRFYRVPEEKISVIYEGILPYQVLNIERQVSDTKYKMHNTKYLLFIGRLEVRKNIIRIIKAFEILKKKYNIPHELALVGKPGFGYEKIRTAIRHSPFAIREFGYVTEEEKWELLRGADAFLFPTLYEGFGLPILEAQAAGVPVVTSDTSSLPEVAGDGAAYCDPESVESIADAIKKTLDDRDFRSGILERGRENMKRFGWDRCAKEIVASLHD